MTDTRELVERLRHSKGWPTLGNAAATALTAQAERIAELEAALRPCVSMLDALVDESGRGVEWGEEDSFRMGEWFEDGDLSNLEAARAALAGKGEA